MEKNSFESIAEHSLEELAELLELSDTKGVLEVEYSDGVLTITLPMNKQYVINRHRVTEKLWWSSPLSGAKYFVLDPEGNWMDGNHHELKALLAEEIKILSGVEMQ